MMTTRNVHLDFHTSGKIGGVGELFDKKQFQNALQTGRVQSVTVFAKCHHGYTYYPSAISEMHPSLSFDLLQAEIDAAHEIEVKAPIYITVGFSQRDAETHPEWLAYDFNTKKPYIHCGWDDGAGAEEEVPMGAWKLLCPVGGYREMILALTKEVCQRYTPDGLFFDIYTVGNECVCPDCVKGMKAMGLDPEKREDCRKYYVQKRVELAEEIRQILSAKNPDATLFFNNGAEIGQPEFLGMHSHFEMEDLPTAWGGYDKLLLRARYLSKYGKEYVGMTGKFHYTWGEFGGFKNPEALRYECAAMLSLGAKCSVGDQMHPSGRMDVSTYEEIGNAYAYVEKLEKYCLNAKTYTDLGVFLSEDDGSSQGLCLLLVENQLEFNVINHAEEIENCHALIVPNALRDAEKYKPALLKHIQSGKPIVLIGDAPKRIGCAPCVKGKSEFDVDYILANETPYVLKTPFLSYSSPYVAESDGFETLAQSVNPYFNRRYGHFCSHSNTPYDLTAKRGSALLKRENVLYFAHDIPKSYHDKGNFYLKQYFTAGLKTVYDKPLLQVSGLMSCGRATAAKNESENFYVVNVLYAAPVLRGNAFILEDFPTIDNCKVKLKVAEKVKKVMLVPQEQEVAFEQMEDGCVEIQPFAFSVHQALAIYY